MKKEELYNEILGEEITITGGTNGVGFSCTGVVNNIKGDTIMIDNIIVVLSGNDVKIEQNENHFHININKQSEIFISKIINT